MRGESVIGLLFVIVGLILSVYGLCGIIFSHNITLGNAPFLVLGPCLMILGALFRYTLEIARVEKKIEKKDSKLSNWRVRDLEYRLKKLERDESKKREETTEIKEAEFEKFKEIADKLLNNLGKENIKEFKDSQDFEFYKKVTEQKETNDQEKKKFILIVDKLLGKLPQEKIESFVKDKVNYPTYHKVVRWAE